MISESVVDFLAWHDHWIVPGVWAVFLVIVYIAERLRPARGHSPHRRQRWITNIVLGITSASVGRLLAYWLLPAMMVILLPLTPPTIPVVVPGFWSLVLEVMVLDLVHYLTHRSLHAVPGFWAVHRAHHSDTSVDASTGLRSHPLEAVIATIPVFLVVWIGNFSVAGVVFYVLSRSAMDIVNHGNFSYPHALDRVLRRLLVTPDVHRIHHSSRRVETDSNYGGLFTIWDRLLGSYRDIAVGGNRRMRLGLAGFRARRDQRLGPVLRQPFE